MFVVCGVGIINGDWFDIRQEHLQGTALLLKLCVLHGRGTYLLGIV